MQPVVLLNKLQRRAIKLSDSLTDDSKLRNIDMTAIYYDEKEKILANGELLNVQINGDPGSGKSTLMIAEVFHTNALLNINTTMDHIMSNQIVFAQTMREVRHQAFVCIGIDEFDALGKVGYNATTDSASLDNISDLRRDDYIHRYACSPQDLMDKNANIILEVLAPDKQRKFTRCLLYYRILKGGMNHRQLLGYVDIDVSTILDTPFYSEYLERKRRRNHLMGEYGIKSERDIFFAEALLDAYDQLRPIADFFSIDRNLCEQQIDMSSRKFRIVNSMFKTDKDSRDLFSLLNLDKSIATLLKQISKAKEKERDKDIEQLSEQLIKLNDFRTTTHDYWKHAKEIKPLFMSNLAETINLKGDTNATS